LRRNWQDFNWNDASRGPSAIADLLVLLTLRRISKLFCYSACMPVCSQDYSKSCGWVLVKYREKEVCKEVFNWSRDSERRMLHWQYLTTICLWYCSVEITAVDLQSGIKSISYEIVDTRNNDVVVFQSVKNVIPRHRPGTKRRKRVRKLHIRPINISAITTQYMCSGSASFSHWRYYGEALFLGKSVHQKTLLWQPILYSSVRFTFAKLIVFYKLCDSTAACSQKSCFNLLSF